jgi:hypothetical protein
MASQMEAAELEQVRVESSSYVLVTPAAVWCVWHDQFLTAHDSGMVSMLWLV